MNIGKNTHGAGMAVSAASRMIDIHSRSAHIVHEPFCGTGTTMIACEQLSRKCYAMEIEPRYMQLTIDRWEAFTKEVAVKL